MRIWKSNSARLHKISWERDYMHVQKRHWQHSCVYVQKVNLKKTFFSCSKFKLKPALNAWPYAQMKIKLGACVNFWPQNTSQTRVSVAKYIYIYTECPRRNVPDFGMVFLMLKYTDVTQNTYVQSWTVTEIMAREKCGPLAGPRTVPVSWQSYPFPSLGVVSYDGNSAQASHWTAHVLPSGWYVVQVKAALWMVGRLVVRSC